MNAGEIVSAIISSLAVVLLTAIARAMLGLRNDLRRYMTEHVWLLATTLWTRDRVIRIMRVMDLEVAEPPPNDLPPRPR